MPIAVILALFGYFVHRAARQRRFEAEYAEDVRQRQAASIEAARQKRAREHEIEQHRVWLDGPPPALSMPSRFSERWFDDNVPYLHPGQVPMLLDELHARGWKDARIAQRVGPFLQRNSDL